MAWPTIIDDDGSGMTGTVLNKAFFDEMKGYVDGAAGVVTISNGGSNLFDVVLPTPLPLYYVNVVAASAPITLRSMTAGRPGDVVIIQNLGVVHPVWLQFGENTGLDFFNRVRSGATPLGGYGGSALYVWNGLWRLAQHDQGQAIRVPYSAANYFPITGAWTVEAGDVLAHDYVLRGNLLTTTIALQTTTISGTPGVLYVQGTPLPNAVGLKVPMWVVSPTSYSSGICQAEAGIGRYAMFLQSGTMPTGTNTIEIFASITGLVT